MIIIPGYADPDRIPSGTEIKFDVPVPGRITLAELLKAGVAVLNGPDHPIPSLDCYCYAPDAATYDTTQRTASLIRNGRRVGHVFEDEMGTVVRDEMLVEPEDILAGELVLFPEPT